MKNIENKEGSCKYYVPHYVKVGNSFITCRAGHCKLQKKEGVLIDEDKKICECFEAQDMAEYLKKPRERRKKCRVELLKNTEELLKLLGN